ncbi:MAG: hypothetical protein LAP40_06400 [Acidobacteriia bacterium]|nr:hypothetical protein [Terriglobia bacterium]
MKRKCCGVPAWQRGEWLSPAQGRALCRCLVVVLCAAGAGFGETQAERGKRVVDQAVQALGGDAFRNMEDRTESGRAYSFYREELSGLSIAKIYTRYLTPAPGQLSSRERQSFGKDGYSSVLFTDLGAWELTFRGARPLTDQRYDAYKDSTLRNIFYILRQRLGEPGLILSSQGADIFQNLPVEIVDITDADNRTVTVYFSQSTKLPVRQSFRRRNPDTKDWDVEVTAFSKYRDVGGGVKWPFDVHRERNGEKIYEMFSDSVEINRNLTDDLFTLPGSVKVLPKAK